MEALHHQLCRSVLWQLAIDNWGVICHLAFTHFCEIFYFNILLLQSAESAVAKLGNVLDWDRTCSDYLPICAHFAKYHWCTFRLEVFVPGCYISWWRTRQRYNLQFETPGLPRLPRLRDSQDSGTPGRLMEKVKATSRKFHSSPNHFQVQIQA